MARPRKYDSTRIRELYAAGHSYQAISCAVGCPAREITRALKDDDTDEDGLDDLSGARCSCGLRLPCNGCLTDTQAYTRGPGRVMPAGADVSYADTNEINEACDRFKERCDSRR